MSDYVMHRDANAEQFLTLLAKQNKEEERFLSTCIDWLIVRNNTIGELKSLADDIDKHHKNVNIATLSATSVSALGGFAIIGGLLLAPVTAGISATLAIGGTVASMFGGVTAVGSALVEVKITQQRCKITQAYIDLDNNLTERLIRDMDTFLELSGKLDLLMTTCFTDTTLMEIANQIDYMAQIQSFGKHTLHKIWKLNKKVETIMKNPEVKKVYQLLMKTLRFCGFTVSNKKTDAFQMIEKLKLSKLANLSKKDMFSFKGLFINPAKLYATVKVGIGSVTAVCLVVNIWSIVKTSIDIHHGSKAETGNKVREVLLKFEEGRNIINDIIQDMN